MDLTKELQRGGVRGGREQFNWDSLKTQSHRDRQQYLGYSTKLGTGGRFGKFDRNDWWRTEKSESSNKVDIEAERRSIKKMEEDLMNEALGLRPKQHSATKPVSEPEKLIKSEVTSNLQSSAVVKPVAATREDDEEGVRQVSGLGFRKYLKPTDWTDIQDVEDILEAKGEELIVEPLMKTEPQDGGIRRVFGPVRPPPFRIKEEETKADEGRKHRSRSRDR